MSLAQYKRKRHFNNTPEPVPAESQDPDRRIGKGKKLEFVVQKHQATQLHYDFRLELGGVLKSWAVPKGPSLSPHQPRLAMMVEDHPYKYRKFTGEIPEGNYGAGKVEIWDSGWYELRIKHDEKDQEELLRDELKAGHLTFILHGKKLKGEFALVRSPKMAKNAWLLIKKGDKYAKSRA